MVTRAALRATRDSRTSLFSSSGGFALAVGILSASVLGGWGTDSCVQSFMRACVCQHVDAPCTSAETLEATWGPCNHACRMQPVMECPCAGMSCTRPARVRRHAMSAPSPRQRRRRRWARRACGCCAWKCERHKRNPHHVRRAAQYNQYHQYVQAVTCLGAGAAGRDARHRYRSCALRTGAAHLYRHALL